MTRHFGSNKILDIVEVKSKVAEIKKIVDELYDRPFIPASVITKIKPEIEVKNTWSISEKAEQRVRKKRKHWIIEKENL